jgi:hypothetical protein
MTLGKITPKENEKGSPERKKSGSPEVNIDHPF